MDIKFALRKILKIDPRIMRRLRILIAPFRRVGIKKDFTLLSDNCWGGRLYDKFHLPYLTPTVGLYIKNSDFLKFIEHLENYLISKPIPIEETQSKVNGEWGLYDCLLNDIIIGFRHYSNANDGITKWERRKKRIVKNNIILKLSYTEDDVDLVFLEKFVNLPYKKIVFFKSGQIIPESIIKKCNAVIFIPADKLEAEFMQADKLLKMKKIKDIINQ